MDLLLVLVVLVVVAVDLIARTQVLDQVVDKQ
jgi:hypothetical protein